MTGQRVEEQAEQTMYHTRASVVRAAAANDATPDDLMKLIMKQAKDPSIFTQDGVVPFTWQADVSNGALDSYFTRQDNQSLRNYAKQATDGVMFLDSHDKHQLGFGQSIRGVFTPAAGKIDDRTPDDTNVSTVAVDFYTVPGVQLGRASSDSFIAGVRSGIIHDVSIGFMPDRFECNLCRNDPFDWWSMDCPHIPGAYYDSTMKNIVTKRSDGAIQAFAWVRDSRLLEVSAVYDGATPGAYIKKAQFLADAGELNRSAAGILERQLRIHLPEQALSVPVLAIRDGKMFLDRGESVIIDGAIYHEGSEVMPRTFKRLNYSKHAVNGEQNRSEDNPTQDMDEAEDGIEQVTPPSENANLKREESPAGVASTSGGITSPSHAAPEELRSMNEEQIRALQAQATEDADTVKRARRALSTLGVKDAETADLEAALIDFGRQIQDLTPRAKMGDDWRAAEIERALGAGVRAMAQFDRAEWTETFESMQVKQIQLLASTWEAQAPNLGGRRTADIGTEAPGEKRTKKSVDAPMGQFAVNGSR